MFKYVFLFHAWHHINHNIFQKLLIVRFNYRFGRLELLPLLLEYQEILSHKRFLLNRLDFQEFDTHF